MEIEEAVIAAAKKLGWRLKARHCHCLARDLFFVLVGVRPLVMIDYLPYSANLLQLLTSLVNSVCEAFKGWRLMSMDESMIYFLHAANLEEYMESSLGDESWLSFIILDDGPARMATQLEEQSVKATLKRLQARLSQSLAEESRECSLIDFNHGLSELDISIPTCNGDLRVLQRQGFSSIAVLIIGPLVFIQASLAQRKSWRGDRMNQWKKS
ncbi:uncharacterized protein LOC9663272 isoform X4 [Selaginella moellendorffii]|uniref:uncharacterized protein LOC9663272 isoform X4 n=1 Tax=Selaginella moellendorffii TaxID=88036 RepID=UPI000D1C57DA|nr:uncharacterized protein LOC9663272 isoform X4 [Selaginella moellendorffii]XP_024540305.1 uncharacterized protein LOC9663272 isoform X4 [Selaginella moellendorffii]|eukprot:XP_024540301.1 uncharacterized protein LOC9663272 isoform X4 [Selaginella moellendorffii]